MESRPLCIRFRDECTVLLCYFDVCESPFCGTEWGWVRIASSYALRNPYGNSDQVRLEARLRAIRRFRRLCWLRDVDREGTEVVSAYLRFFLPYPYTGCVLVLLKFGPK
jgi:hypothetical protein